jgi:hypothetical protein
VGGVGHVTSAYRQPNPPETCVWGCGRRDFNVEHIIGQQFANLLDAKLPLTAHWGDHREAMPEGLEIAIPGRVCLGCNNGWMRKLDNRVIGFMRAAIKHDAPVSLNTPFRQTQLSFWAAKIAFLLLVFQYELTERHQLRGMGPFTIPYANLESLWKRGRPPEGTRVWVGARDRRDNVPFIHHEGTLFRPTTDPARGTVEMEDGSLVRDAGFRVLFTLQRLVFAVWGWHLDYGEGTLEGLEDPNDLVPDSMLPIWPASAEENEWPPPHCLSSEEIGRICYTEAEWVQ